MIAGLLLLAHGALGLLALPTMFLRGAWRGRVLIGLCLVGAGFGVTLIVLNGSLEEWRASQVSGIGTVAGIAITTSWLVAAVVCAAVGRSLACSLVGVAASGMALAVTSQWVVPALLFWLCSSLAVAGLAAQSRGGPWVWGLLFASDAALVAALLGNWVDTRAWILPDALDGWTFYVLVLAAVLRAGVVPLSGTWSLLGKSAPAVPLLVGGAFAILRVGLGEADPWVGVALFLASLAVALTVLVARRPWGGVAAAAAAAIAVLLGLAAMAPAALSAAGAAAVVAGGTAALWAPAPNEGAPDRVFALMALPPTVAFVAAAVGLVTALGHTAGSEETVEKVPWTLALIAAPLALTANLAVAARLAGSLAARRGWLGRVRRRDRGALAVLVTRLLLVFAVAAAVMPGEWLGIETDVAAWEPRRALSFGAALLLGAAAAWFAVRRPAPAMEAAPAPAPRWRALAWLDAPASGTIGTRLLTASSLLFAIAAIAGVGWLTFEGLRLGFL